MLFRSNRFSHFPYGSESSWAYAAQYVMRQNVAAYYPEITDAVAKEGLPFGTGAWSYINEHHLEIGKALHSTVNACKDYVDLLANLITHFESFVP